MSEANGVPLTPMTVTVLGKVAKVQSIYTQPGECWIHTESPELTVYIQGYDLDGNDFWECLQGSGND